MMRMMAAEAKGSAPTPVEAGELTVSANVTAIFALLSADDEMPQDGGAMDQRSGFGRCRRGRACRQLIHERWSTSAW